MATAFFLRQQRIYTRDAYAPLRRDAHAEVEKINEWLHSHRLFFFLIRGWSGVVSPCRTAPLLFEKESAAVCASYLLSLAGSQPQRTHRNREYD